MRFPFSFIMIPFFLKIIHPNDRVVHSADSAHLRQTDPFLFTHLFQALQNFLSAIDPEHVCIPQLSVLHNHVPPFQRNSGFIIPEKPCIINVRAGLPAIASPQSFQAFMIGPVFLPSARKPYPLCFQTVYLQNRGGNKKSESRHIFPENR